MSIFFHSGTNLELSLAEIKSIFNVSDEKITYSKENLIIELDIDLDNKTIITFQKRLWWSIKISKGILKWNIKDIENWISNKLIKKKELFEWKIRFWLNSYAKWVNLKSLLLNSKKNIKWSRFLNNDFKNLSSVVTKKQIIEKNWIEFNIIDINNTLYLTETISIQDIDFYSERDYWKPHRDAKVWMLPPKLAQILINLAWNITNIWDPFCWLWVIPIEAYILWINEIYYSDIEKKMVLYSQKNLEWIKEKFNLEIIKTKLEWFVNDVMIFKEIQVDTVVTEWYLWTPLENYATQEYINLVDENLSILWEKALNNFEKNKIKKIVFCLPAFPQKNWNIIFLRKTLEKIKESKYTLQAIWKNERKTIVYRRNNQFVNREIVKLHIPQ